MKLADVGTLIFEEAQRALKESGVEIARPAVARGLAFVSVGTKGALDRTTIVILAKELVGLSRESVRVLARERVRVAAEKLAAKKVRLERAQALLDVGRAGEVLEEAAAPLKGKLAISGPFLIEGELFISVGGEEISFPVKTVEKLGELEFRARVDDRVAAVLARVG